MLLVLVRNLSIALFLALWLAFAPCGFAAAPDVSASARAAAADLMSIYSLAEDKQPEAVRDLLRAKGQRIADLAQTIRDNPAYLDDILSARALPITDDQREMVKTLLNGAAHSSVLESLRKFNVDRVGQIPDQNIADFLKEGSAALQQLSISNQPGFQRILDSKDGVTITDPQMRTLAHEYLPKFFDGLPLRIKSRMVAAVLRLPAGASTADQAAAVLQNAGPLVQKLFQLIGRKTDSPELEAVMTKLQADIKPIPREKIMETLNGRYGAAEVEKKFAKISEPISSGSVGQAHFANLTSNGQQVVIKVRRPGVIEDFQDEVAVLKKVTEGTEFSVYADKITSNIGKELDFRNEAENLREGEVYINSRRGIGIAALIKDFDPAEDVLVMEKAKGQKISNFTRAPDLVERGKAMSRLLESWIRQSVFRDGFFHGDLHPGNVFLELPGPGQKASELTLIDFGNAGRISRVQQKAFVHLLAALTLRSPEELLSAIEKIGPMRKGERAQFLAELKKVLAVKPTKPLFAWYQSRLEEVMKHAVQHGVDLPESFASFARGKAFLEIELGDINGKLNELDPEKKFPRFDPLGPELRAMMKEAPAAVKNMVTGKENGPISAETVRNLFRSWKTSPYRSDFKGFCNDFFRQVGKKENPSEESAETAEQLPSP